MKNKKMAWMYTKTISSEILMIVASWFLSKKKIRPGRIAQEKV